MSPVQIPLGLGDDRVDVHATRQVLEVDLGRCLLELLNEAVLVVGLANELGSDSNFSRLDVSQPGLVDHVLVYDRRCRIHRSSLNGSSVLRASNSLILCVAFNGFLDDGL